MYQRKHTWIPVAFIIVILLAIAVRKTPDTNDIAQEFHFVGTVLDLSDQELLVRVDEGQPEWEISNMIRVSRDVEMGDGTAQFKAGDRVAVYYSEELVKAYPAKIDEVFAIVPLTDDQEPGQKMPDSSSGLGE